MQNFTQEYRTWMIQEINSALNHPLVDTDLMTTSYIESLYEAIGCLLPQSSHTTRNRYSNRIRSTSDNIYES